MISDDIIRKHDVTYHAANEEPMHSCGSVELTVKRICDALTNDRETLRSFALISAIHDIY